MLQNIYSLPEIELVGGASKSLQFTLYRNGTSPTPFDFYGGSANFSVVNIVNKNGEPLISKDMQVDTSTDDKGEQYCNVLRVMLMPKDTVNLFGKFVYQLTLKDASGNIDIPHQGIIYIHNNINRAYINAAL